MEVRGWHPQYQPTPLTPTPNPESSTEQALLSATRPLFPPLLPAIAGDAVIDACSRVDDVKTLVTNSVSVNSTPPLDQEVGSWVSAKGRDLLVSANDVDASGMPLTQAPHTQAVIDARMDAWVGGASVAVDRFCSRISDSRQLPLTNTEVG